MEETWKDIARYEGLYQVSSKGRIRSLSHYARNNPNGGRRLITGRILIPYKMPSGYLMVKLSKGEKREKISVHRLVALAFIDNKYNLSEVNHIDGNKANNSIENLEWVTHKENQNHMYDSGLNKKAKPVECIEDGTTYRSILEATRIKHISKSTIRMACISGKPCKGTHWRFSNADNWKEIKEKAEPALEALKSHPWKSNMSLAEMIEKQAEEGKETEDEIQNKSHNQATR